MEKNDFIQIMLIDDHQIVIDGLHALLKDVPDVKVIGEANSGEEALRALEYLRPDLLLLDVNMPGMDGVQTCIKAKEKRPGLAVMALTMHNDKGVIQSMTKAGALGYVLKNTSREELVEAIRKVHGGKRFLSEEATETLLTGGTPPANDTDFHPAGLTGREKEILNLIAEGFSNTEIGEQLSISHRTVDTHRTNLMKKIGVRNIAGLIKYAFRHGIIS